jgi:hypothetical protein
MSQIINTIDAGNLVSIAFNVGVFTIEKQDPGVTAAIVSRKISTVGQAV